MSTFNRKTRYSGHTFSRLSRDQTQHVQTNPAATLMKGHMQMKKDGHVSVQRTVVAAYEQKGSFIRDLRCRCCGESPRRCRSEVRPPCVSKRLARMHGRARLLTWKPTVCKVAGEMSCARRVGSCRRFQSMTGRRLLPVVPRCNLLRVWVGREGKAKIGACFMH